LQDRKDKPFSLKEHFFFHEFVDIVNYYKDKGQQFTQLTLISSGANSCAALFEKAFKPSFLIQKEINLCIGLVPYKHDTFIIQSFELKNLDKFLINRKTLLKLIFIE